MTELKENFSFKEILRLIERGVRKIEGTYIDYRDSSKFKEYKITAYRTTDNVIRIDLKKIK